MRKLTCLIVLLVLIAPVYAGWFGLTGKATNTFRPTKTSIMLGNNLADGYGPVSEAALVEKLNLFK